MKYKKHSDGFLRVGWDVELQRFTTKALDVITRETKIIKRPTLLLMPKRDYFKLMGFTWWERLRWNIKDFFRREGE